LVYACSAQWVRDEDGRVRKGYRFNVIDNSGAEPRLLCIVNDICSTEEEARALEQLFRRNNIALCHVVEVLEDWVASRR
jgi:hypothetical protein